MKIPSQRAVRLPACGRRPRRLGPRVTPIDAPAVPGPGRPESGRPVNWLDAVTSQVALAPISTDGVRGAAEQGRSPSMSRPFRGRTSRNGSFASLRSRLGGASPPGPSRGAIAGRGKIQKLCRWLNESAYFVSVPFLCACSSGLRWIIIP